MSKIIGQNMYYFRLFIFAVAAACVSACSSPSKEEAARRDFDNSISNAENEPAVSDVIFRRLTDPETRSIYEVFTGREFGHGRLFLRTNPEDRNGLYAFVMFKTYVSEIQKDSTIELFIQPKNSFETKKFVWTVPENSSLLREVALGITGADAAGLDAENLAWKIRIKNPEDGLITQRQSWLWSIDNPSAEEK